MSASGGIVSADARRMPEEVWQERRRSHEARVEAWIGPHRVRAARGERHPVWDFLFSYYAFRPSWLRQWHPGPDVILGGTAARDYLRWPEYRPLGDGVGLDLGTLPAKRRDFAVWLGHLLAETAGRPAFFGCFGLHEWAMVYRQSREELRHAGWPLRHPPAVIAEIVESQTLCCTHFDAFRFFTPAAVPRNRLALTREQVPAQEQRGCLHANMDLYKWAFKLAPYSPSDLVADAFALARDIRELDMRASPYDLESLGFPAIAIETPEGRQEYERLQREFSRRGEPIRDRLRLLCDRLVREAEA